MGYGNEEVFLSAEERENLIHNYLGKTVDVVIDRPIGYHHVTKGVHLDYTVNYGYLPGVTGGDGEEQDVYVLGVDKPLTHFTGRVIAAIRRKDDNEDKFVAAPEGMRLHQGEIARAVHFVEKYFDSTIDSIFEKSCGVIPFRKIGKDTQLLLLYQTASGCWSFPKGHMEMGETEEDTVRRELREEIGLEAALLPDFRASVEYRVSDHTRKEVVLFLGQVSGEMIMEPGEIETFRWVTLEAAKTLMGSAYAAVLEQVEGYLGRQIVV